MGRQHLKLIDNYHSIQSKISSLYLIIDFYQFAFLQD
jgi:hypothetical protein